MRSLSKSTLVTIVKFVIPAAIIGYLVWRIEPEQWHQLTVQPKDYLLLLAALLVALAAMSLSFARWCVLVRCQGIELTMMEAFRLGSIGFLLSFVSAGSVGGDLFKAVFLANRRPGKRVAAVASVVVDRGCGLYGLLLLVSLALLLTSPTDTSESSIGLDRIKFATAAFLGLGTVVLAILVFGGRSVDRLIRGGSELPMIGSLVAKIGPPLRMFHSHPIAFGASILMSLGVQSMMVISIYLIARECALQHFDDLVSNTVLQINHTQGRATLTGRRKCGCNDVIGNLLRQGRGINNHHILSTGFSNKCVDRTGFGGQGAVDMLSGSG